MDNDQFKDEPEVNRQFEGEIKVESAFMSGDRDKDFQEVVKSLIVSKSDSNYESDGQPHFFIQADIARKLGLNRSTVFGLLKNYEKILQSWGLVIKSGDQTMYHERVVVFLKRQAAYREEHHLSAKSLAEELEKNGVKSELLLTDAEIYLTRLNEMNERRSQRASSQLSKEIKAQNDELKEMLAKILRDGEDDSRVSDIMQSMGELKESGIRAEQDNETIRLQNEELKKTNSQIMAQNEELKELLVKLLNAKDTPEGLATLQQTVNDLMLRIKKTETALLRIRDRTNGLTNAATSAGPFSGKLKNEVLSASEDIRNLADDALSVIGQQ